MDILPQWVLLILCALHQVFAAVLTKRTESQNLFVERACCRRQSLFVYIGQDISGSPVNVDVGVCRTHCGGPSRAQALESGLQGPSKHSSMLDFLRSKKMRVRAPAPPEAPEGTGDRAPSCGFSSTCEPTRIRVEKVLLYDGLREVDVIEDCHCEARMPRCVRVPALRAYFFETPYETVVDVGRCSGSKGAADGFSCLPTKFDSALVKTPNQVELIKTVVDCDLKEGCYRIPYVEYHYQITFTADGVKEESLKEIDVGRCFGSCTIGNRCLLRGASDTSDCLRWAEGQGRACVPESYESYTFLDRHSHVRTVLAIASCRCQA